MTKLRFRSASSFLESLREPVLDFFCARMLRPCDVIITMSGMGMNTAQRAKKRFGAAFWTERSSTHIRDQFETLKHAGIRTSSSWPKIIEKEESFYREADMIVTPSSHCVRSLQNRGIPSAKIFQSSFGINVDLFQWNEGPISPQLEFLFVGNWSKRKGADLLRECLPSFPQIKFRQFGPVSDAAPIENAANFQHMGMVDQRTLPSVYATAHALVLPSYEEGFAVVILQALACGLLVFCSDRTGGQDLVAIDCMKGRVIAFPSGDVHALKHAIESHLQSVPTIRKDASRSAEIRKQLSTATYAQRYADKLIQTLVKS